MEVLVSTFSTRMEPSANFANVQVTSMANFARNVTLLSVSMMEFAVKTLATNTAACVQKGRNF